MNTKKLLAGFICSIALLGAITPTASAHNITPSTAFRWEHVTYNSSYGHNVARIQFNDDYASSSWKPYTTQMRANWNTNSNNYVNAVAYAFGSSNVDMANKASWPAEWGANTVATTRVFNDGVDVSFSTAAMNSTDYAQIFTNPAADGLGSFMITLVGGHELGHVFGLGHPPDGTVSIMTQGQTNWQVPQAHDRTDLDYYY
ncbi:hypothetical protein [Paenibacillus sp. MMS18-CY102]|uniref:hypothetical protein n=1 Tax=Paenibacillus sp. MMS18-CY102 TaxID=2682849 RepID=UPI0013661E8E|nr:hypothetical protein [Paenibacillus sp. MMS18-CY102]MWC31049.1 hypothetical protein [Paenibacillus sp. MMS18-CY102]